MKTAGKLTPQQEGFCQEVAKGKSLSDAYRAHYKVGPKTKTESVNELASRLFAQVHISSRVTELTKAAVDLATVDASEFLREAARLAMSDISGIIGPDGKVLLPHELDKNTRAAVSSFKIDEFGRIEYKFWDKNAALEKLFKHRGLYKVDNEQKTDPVAALVAAVLGNVQGVAKGDE